MARILLVDDYPDALDVWSVYLRMCGFDVVTAGDGLAAWDAANRHACDLAILDLEMPGMSGFELARQLRAHQPTSGMPLIAVSGHSQPAKVEEARQSGFDLVLTKPCDPEVLCHEIDRLLEPSARDTGVTHVATNRHETAHRG